MEYHKIKKFSVYQPGNYNCDLCLTEKLHIIKSANNPNNINKRNDIESSAVVSLGTNSRLIPRFGLYFLFSR